MYDRPQTRAAHDLLWQHIRQTLDLPTCPEALSRSDAVWDHWLSPDLLLSQSCGMPYRERLHSQVSLVGVWDHAIDCAPGQYYSVMVARLEDPRDALSDFALAPLAYNDPMSQSGWAAPQNLALSQGWHFSKTVQSGSHRSSARMVADGMADLAAIDVISWTMMQRWDSFPSRLKIIARTPPTPALPLITARPSHVAPLQRAITAALDSLPDDVCNLLCIRSLKKVTPQDYMAVPSPKCPSVNRHAPLQNHP